MKLHSLYVKGYRRIEEATIVFGDTTFLIGPNNIGKSSILSAIEELLSAKETLSEFDFNSKCEDNDLDRFGSCAECIVEAEFRNLPQESLTWQGFKGRVLRYDVGAVQGDSGLSIVYRKIYGRGQKCLRQMKMYKKTMRVEFENAKCPQELIDLGVDSEVVRGVFGDLSKKFPKTNNDKLEEINEIWDVDESSGSDWFTNPGGLHPVVLSKLPLCIKIKAEHDSSVFDPKSGDLAKIMNELFKDIRESSPNYCEAMKHLGYLAQELDPTNTESEFGAMMSDLNKVIGSVFPDSRIHATANLDDPDKSLNPVFTINMSSNVKTPVSYQGTVMVRSALFALLKFRHEWSQKRKGSLRSVIIGFEEPEIYLHPNAANQMRDTIYELSVGSSQIVCTSHSPYMIDLSRKPHQVLNRMSIVENVVTNVAFNVTDAFHNLLDSDRLYVKMLMKIDDYIARVFFAEKVIIVEGDTEDVVFRETFSRLPVEVKNIVYSKVQVVKARGKGTIISLINYLKPLGLNVFVIHDRDLNILRAEQMNNPILYALGDPSRRVMLEENMENILGIPASTDEKPYNAFKATQQWGDTWEDIPEKWRIIVEQALAEYLTP